MWLVHVVFVFIADCLSKNSQVKTTEMHFHLQCFRARRHLLYLQHRVLLLLLLASGQT
jgi:hypothetical protein